MSGRRLGLPAALLLAGAALLAHANGIPGGFTYDDKAIVRDNPRIRSPSSLPLLFSTQYFGGPPGSGTAYRPVLLLSFAVEWWIHGGDATAFRAVNVLLHAAATLLLARFLLELELGRAVAVGAALLFAVHPIHVEAVAGIVGRGETQAAALTLLSLLLAMRSTRSEAGPRWRRFLALPCALAAYLLAVLTKESAAVAPALLFLALAWKVDGKPRTPSPARGGPRLAVRRRRGRGPRRGLRGAGARSRRGDQERGNRHLRAGEPARAPAAREPGGERVRGPVPLHGTARPAVEALRGRVRLVDSGARARAAAVYWAAPLLLGALVARRPAGESRRGGRPPWDSSSSFCRFSPRRTSSSRPARSSPSGSRTCPRRACA